MSYGNGKRVGLTVLLSIITIIAVIAVVTGVWYKVKGFDEINHSFSSEIVSSSNADDLNKLGKDYVFTQVSNSQINAGDLILVNNYYEYKGDSSDIAVIYESKNEFYSVSSYEDSAKPVLIENLNLMLKDFVTATNKNDINIISAFRTRELQQQLYDEGDAEYVARPGHSEHETGYAVDFGLYDGQYSSQFDGVGEYEWISKNCYKFGFILRYPLDMESVTQIKYEPWHYRYVGRPHAYYIWENGICLEQYIELMRMYPFNGEHLLITDYNAEMYEIYYVSKDMESEFTQVPVPKDKSYTISGDNIGGFIVTVKV
ncbi:MAG: M15 family metallopeptidase [Clostridiales bacterium]|jgi:D-alanyl-D-alanine carboxypeptidase|nr:M15 family metallopeptidase [Clostridiales bacterium]